MATLAPVKATRFRKRIRIEQEDRSRKDGKGGYKLQWVLVSGCDSVPAEITYPPPSKKGDETVAQQQVQSSVFATITIRYRPSINIDASMHVVYGSRTFNIRTVLPVDEARQLITLQCEELQAQGTLH